MAKQASKAAGGREFGRFVSPSGVLPHEIRETAVGIDVAKDTLTATVRRRDLSVECREFPNSPCGHKQLIAWSKRRVQKVCAIVESTGTYSVDLALTIKSTPGMDVMVLNSKAARHYAQSIGVKDKDEKTDSRVLLDYGERMPFQPWTSPPIHCLQLRGVTRQIRALLKAKLVQDNQARAASFCKRAPKPVLTSANNVSAVLEREVKVLYREAKKIAQADPDLAEKLRLLQTIKGVAERSALLLLGELCVLPPSLSAREWAAHAGLCPRRFESGTSVHKPWRIGKAGNSYLRAALFMPAITAAKHDPGARAFAERLRSSGKKPLQTVVAIMRKLLHAAHAILTTGQPYNSALIFPACAFPEKQTR